MCPQPTIAPVTANHESRAIPTYPIPDPDQYPVFFEKRVYQGSSGRVYPLPFYSSISDEQRDQHWDIWTLENEFVRVELMPELGGRVWRAVDKTNGYDLFYHQPVVKPALVGLAGPWISGGIEFNWPQHHRPATYLPADTFVEEHEDGSRTVWMSDHDPMSHLKGMLGVQLHPDCSRIDMKLRLYNRTPTRQSFLWWANAAAEVHDQYQSFFPPDVQYVADHAVRAMSRFPIATGRYYGVDYAPGTDLSWYKNIPVPTSYMVTKTDYDFFGGYDHAARSGFVHVADRHQCPGKKQWTWGNHDFGWAWDRELTEPNNEGRFPPYIELMAGIFTDNQPDFSYLLPYETRTFTHTWWPIREIGVAHQADEDNALHLSVADGKAHVGLCASRPQHGVQLQLTAGGQVIHSEAVDLAPDRPVSKDVPLPEGCRAQDLSLQIVREGDAVLSYTPPELDENAPVPDTATEPPMPKEIASSDELYLTGEHLEQYRHPTRSPEMYWLEALSRDAGDMRSNAAMGKKLLDRGLNRQAADHLQRSVDRSRRRHPNPEDGEPVYCLGLALKRLDENEEAYRWLYKATWNGAWRGPAYYQLATLDASRGRWQQALDHLDSAIRANTQLSQAHVLQAAILRRLGRAQEAIATLDQVLAEDPLDHWARYERVLLAEADAGKPGSSAERQGWIELTGLRTPTLLDLAFDYCDAGLFEEAAGLLAMVGDGPPAMVGYTRAWCLERAGKPAEAAQAHEQAKQSDARWCFPDRFEEERVLQAAIKRDPNDVLACYALGNLLYDKRRYDEAITAWELGRERDNTHAGLCRNLGIAYFNVRADATAAADAYAAACAASPSDAQLLYESDLLNKITGQSPESRLSRLENSLGLVSQRDDLSIEYITLLNRVGRHDDAAALLASRRFHPWEGGEGSVLAQYETAHLALASQALNAGDPERALHHAEMALNPTDNLGEARHLLANTADIQYTLGRALRMIGRDADAVEHFERAAQNTGDFLEMDVQPYSEKSYYLGLALRELGQDEKAAEVFNGMVAYGQTLCETEAKIDYFATSLPDLLVFHTDLQRKREQQGKLLQALGQKGLGDTDSAADFFEQVTRMDPSQLIPL